jgi:phage replication O-like protein O
MSAQLENGYIRIANEIWDEIIRRDFTKRQKDILQFILRLSYGCNNKVAHIPLLKDFALCGVGQNHIKQELNYLRECKVIDWDRSEMTFSFNKKYDFWQMSPVKGWDKERFKELIHCNITSQNGNFPKQELPERGSTDFPKREVVEPEIPYGTKGEEVSKDSIKDIQEEVEETAMDAYRFSFKKMTYTGHIQIYVQELMKKGFTDAFVREVFLEMGERGANPDVNYMRKLAEDWISKGIYTRIEAKRRREKQDHGEQEAKQEQERAKLRLASEPITYEPSEELRSAVNG